MTKLDQIKDAVLERYENNEISLSQAAAIFEAAEEKYGVTEESAYIDSLEYDLLGDVTEESAYLDSLEYDLFSEGANLESRKIYKELRAKYKDGVKSAKTLIKNGEYSKAKVELAGLKKIVEQYSNEIKNTESNAGSVIFGLLANNLMIMLEGLIPVGLPAGAISGGLNGISTVSAIYGNASVAATSYTIGSVFTGIASLNAWIVGIKNLIEQIVRIVDGLRDGEPTIEVINLYKNKLLSICKSLNRHIDILIKQCDKKIEKEKSEAHDAVKESVDSVRVNDLKLAIYENCESGYITDDEKNAFLSIIDN